MEGLGTSAFRVYCRTKVDMSTNRNLLLRDARWQQNGSGSLFRALGPVVEHFNTADVRVDRLSIGSDETNLAANAHSRGTVFR